jgi:orotidine-5'-phosphate decarboxylase
MINIPTAKTALSRLGHRQRPEALEIVSELRDDLGIQNRSSTLHGLRPDIVRKIIGMGGGYSSTSSTMASSYVQGLRRAVKLGVSIFNVHALGGFDMMKATAESREAAEKHRVLMPIVLTVTVLPAWMRRAAPELKISRSIQREVSHLARLAQRAGLQGVVASPQEVKMLRRAVRGKFVILTPGVRPAWASKDDQKRIMTPAEAVAAGADYLVIGRPVLKAKDRKAAVKNILDEINACDLKIS